MGLYVNLSRNEIEDFYMDGKFQPAFRLPVLPVNSAKVIGTITYRAGETNYKPHLVGFASSAFGFLQF